MLSEIIQIFEDKSQFLQLLLIGDESETMVGKYIDRGALYVGFIDDRAVAVCMTTYESETVIEVKNLAVLPEWQRKGIGKQMLSHIEKINAGKTIILGMGETPSTLRFYRSCGYIFSHKIPNFFTDNYNHPIVEGDIVLKDMILLERPLLNH